jgi:hypothetical protein
MPMNPHLQANVLAADWFSLIFPRAGEGSFAKQQIRLDTQFAGLMACRDR